MKKALFVSLMFFASITCLWAQKYQAVLKMTDGAEQKGEVADWKVDDTELKFFPADDGKSVKIASADVAVMTVTFKGGDSAEYEYVPVIKLRSVYKKTNEIGGHGWFEVQMRGYMTIYHHRTPSTMTNIGNPKGPNMSPGSTMKYCRREGEPGISVISQTFSVGTNGVFKGLAQVYFDDDQQIVDKINNETYTYKDIEAIVTEYNSRHGKK